MIIIAIRMNNENISEDLGRGSSQSNMNDRWGVNFEPRGMKYTKNESQITPGKTRATRSHVNICSKDVKRTHMQPKPSECL